MIRLVFFIFLPLILFLTLFRLVSFAFNSSYALFSETYDYNENSLKEIDFNVLSRKTQKYTSQGYGKTSFASVNTNILNHWHNGIDIAAVLNAPIHSVSDGKVVYVGNQDTYCFGRGYGKFLSVGNSKDGYTLLYAHLNRANVKTGDEVHKGDILGFVGETGYATGPHLHFTVFKSASFKIVNRKDCGSTPSGADINPFGYLK